MSLAEVRWIDLPHVAEPRGVLTAVEGAKDIPFEIRRIFYMHGTPAGLERGGHAHRDTQQFVVAVAGQFKIELSDERATERHVLSDPNKGLYMPPMTWVRLHDFSPAAVCLVIADTHYDRARSIRTWQEFCAAVGRTA